MFPVDFPDYELKTDSRKAYIVVVRPEFDKDGCESWTTERISLAQLNSGEKGNMTTIDKVNTNYPVPTDGVLAGYIDRQGVPRLAERGGKKATFLFIGTDYIDNQDYLIASQGITQLPNNKHNYALGKTYYLGENGVPTTDDCGQELFSVLDHGKIIISLK